MLPSRRRWDAQPREPAGVLLASSGAPFSRAATRRACELAAGRPVAVISILRVYGSAFGLPNPGLMPTRREREEQVAIVDRAIRDLERQGCTADGQVTATRSAGRAIAKAARARQVSYVVMDAHPATGIRKVIEGELAAIVRRRLRGAAILDLVGALADPHQASRR
jgi:nucleotide-binding universal stress UspA family protein